jgi:CheY-like chemotaxis protein
MQLANLTSNISVEYVKEFNAKIHSSSHKSKTILIIDDEEIVINICEMMLKRFGHKVLKAHSGYEGLQLFKANKFKIDLIISDLNMPEMDGQELMNELRRIDPYVKVILSSGELTEKVEKIANNSGFNGFIVKPYNMNTLCEKMAEVLC